MTILALDQATRTTGYSVWRDGKLAAYGKETFKDEDLYRRIHTVCGWVRKLIADYFPDKLIFEDIQMQGMVNNVATFQSLAQLQGALIETAYREGISFQFLRPSEWRAICHFLKGNNNRREEQKKIAQQWVLDTYGQKCTQDEADAICIGYAATKTIKDELNWE